jgi:hypothetical protein
MVPARTKLAAINRLKTGKAYHKEFLLQTSYSEILKTPSVLEEGRRAANAATDLTSSHLFARGTVIEPETPQRSAKQQQRL